MIDISQLGEEFISKLAGAYLHASLIFGIEPVKRREKSNEK